ncbi:MAG: helix-turn-helix transcriptional regulator [Eubacteriales bacterium]|nr:helix-turn-helix transcriptional regulator [Eubacteriales bacterium]
MNRLGYILKSAREDNDLTQIQVMRLTGINNKTLSGYENGLAEPDIDTLVTLFKLYGLSFDKAFSIDTDSAKAPPDPLKKRWDDAFEAIPFEKRSDTLNIVETMIKLMETVA